MTPYEQMTEQFSYIKSMKDEIEVIEKDIRINFEENVLNFFKNKGILFEKRKTETFGLPEPVKDFDLKNKIQSEFAQDLGFKKDDKYHYYPPTFRIKGWDFIVKFQWWKSGNQNFTEVYWHPDEMPLEDFYEKKLKRTFKLIK